MERPKILVIDDEKVICELLVQALGQRGYDVESAESGPEALERLCQDFFNLLITDLKLPGMSGIEVLKEIKKVNPYIEVIIVTAYPTVETAVEAIKIGAFDFLSKPFDVPEIVAAIQRCLEKQRRMLDHIEIGELDTFFEISEALGGYSDLDTSLRRILNLTLSLVKARRGSLLLFNEDGGQVRLECGSPHGQDGDATVAGSERAAADGRARPDQEKGDSRSFLSVPLRGRHPFSREDILGVMHVSEKISGDGFTLREQRLFSVLSAQAAAAIENHRLCAQLQEKVGALERTVHELEETRNQLIQTEKLAAVGQLAFGIAHEIRNPLSVILEGVEFLGAAPEGGVAEGEGALERIRKAVVRANGIIVDLLQFSRASKIELREVDIIAILEDVTGFIQNEACLHQVRIRKEYKTSGWRLTGDPNMLKQVFLNLCINAMRAELARSAGPGVGGTVVVRDTGTGIAPDVLAKIFNPFFTTKGPGKGTGLGLSIVHLILQRHGAAIDAHSEPGKGSVFTVTFPPEGAGPGTAPRQPSTVRGGTP